MIWSKEKIYMNIYLELSGAATCGHSFGTIWSGNLRPLIWNYLDYLQPLAATCLDLRLHTTTYGHLLDLELSGAANCNHSLGTVWSGHLRPFAWNYLERLFATTCHHLRSLAVTCGHLRSLAATRLELSGSVTCSRLHKFG